MEEKEEQKREDECDGFGLCSGSFFKTLKGTRFFCSSLGHIYY